MILISNLRLMLFIDFFFSSRRRHTRCSRDWSSDVCSSDLDVVIQSADIYTPRRLVADAEHFQPVALRRNVFIAPTTFLNPNTARRGAAATFEQIGRASCRERV